MWIKIQSFNNNDAKFNGVISEINPLVDKNGLIKVKARITSQDTGLLDGMNVKIYINKLLGTSRFVYNQCLNYKITEYKTNNKCTNISDTNNYVKELKLEHEWIKESHSKVLQQSLMNLEMAYKNFFKEHRGFPNFKSKNSQI